jgi:hypothetical protein
LLGLIDATSNVSGGLVSTLCCARTSGAHAAANATAAQNAAPDRNSMQASLDF